MIADQERRRELAERILEQLRPVLPDLLELLAGERNGLPTVRKFRQVIEAVDRVRLWTVHPEWQRRRGSKGRS